MLGILSCGATMSKHYVGPTSMHDCTWIVHTYTHQSKGNKPSVILFTMEFMLSRLSLRAFYHITHQLECCFICQDYYRSLNSTYHCRTPLHEECLQHHGHKGDLWRHRREGPSDPSVVAGPWRWERLPPIEIRNYEANVINYALLMA